MTRCIDGTTAHHWIIEIPAGPHSPGVCQRCQADGFFKNYLEVKQITVEGEKDPTRESYNWRGLGGTITQYDTSDMA
jgi:hypothetical protein